MLIRKRNKVTQKITVLFLNSNPAVKYRVNEIRRDYYYHHQNHLNGQPYITIVRIFFLYTVVSSQIHI